MWLSYLNLRTTVIVVQPVPGYASQRAAVAERTWYPTRDLVQFAVGTGGRLGLDGRAFVNSMANAAKTVAAEGQVLYRSVSSISQDGVARQLLTAKAAA